MRSCVALHVRLVRPGLGRIVAGSKIEERPEPQLITSSGERKQTNIHRCEEYTYRRAGLPQV